MRSSAVPIALLLLALLVHPGGADATRDREARTQGGKVALVIGNARYDHTTPTPGAKRDAKLVARTLEGLGFQVVQGIDLDKRNLEMRIADFGAALADAEVAFFYYAGHGLQVDGRNFLVPVDADIAEERYVEANAVLADQVLVQMEAAGTDLNIVILDACRNNPFADRWTRGAKVVIGNGLANVMAPSGFIVAFATGPDMVAADDGVYAASLAEQLTHEGKEINDVFAWVHQDVVDASGGGQVPWFTQARGPVPFHPAGEGSATQVLARPLESRQPAATRPTQVRGGRGRTLYTRMLSNRFRAYYPMESLSRAEQRHRSQSYRVRVDGDRLVRAELVNGHGEVIDGSSFASVEQLWDDSGRLIETTTRDRHGNFLRRLTWSEDYSLERWTDRYGRPDREEGTEVSGILCRFDEQGRTIELTHVNAHGMPRANGEGAITYQYEYGELGLWTLARVMSAEGEPAVDLDGVHAVSHEYGEDAELLYARFLDEEMQPIALPSGIAGHRYERDEHGNRVAWTALDTQDRPTHGHDGIARKEFILDEHGDDVEGAYFGSYGEGVIDGAGTHRYRIGRDGRGYPVRGWNFVEVLRGQPVPREDPFHEVRREFDGAGNVILEQVFGEDGSPATLQNGFHGYRSRYDERGRILHQCTLGIDGQPAVSTEGLACFSIEYDDRGNALHRSQLDASGDPTLDSDQHAGWAMEYDPFGNRIRTTFLDEDGEPTRGELPHAIRESRHDHLGNEVSVAFLDEERRPAAIADGYASLTRNYDVQGNIVEIRHFGPAGDAALLADGSHGWRARYDERGREIQRTYLGTDGRPQQMAHGYVSKRYERDGRGRIAVGHLLDADGKPAVATSGIAGWTAEYDRLGNEVEIVYLGPDGSATEDATGVERIRRRFFPGRTPESVEIQLDAGGTPVNLDPQVWARIEADSPHNQTEEISKEHHQTRRVAWVHTDAEGYATRFDRGDLLLDRECVEGCDAAPTGGYVPTARIRFSILRPGASDYELMILEEDYGRPRYSIVDGPALVLGEPRDFFQRWWDADPNRRERTKFQGLKEAVCDAIEELPDDERKFVKMHYFMNKTPEEIREALDLDEGQLEELHGRSLTALWATVGQRMAGGDSDSAKDSMNQSIASILATYHLAVVASESGLPSGGALLETVYIKPTSEDHDLPIADLAEWDVLLDYGGEPIASLDQALAIIEDTEPTAMVTVRILRMTTDKADRVQVFEIEGGLRGVQLGSTPHPAP